MRNPDLRALFQSFGMGEWESSLSIQSAFFIPRTTDPDAQVTIELVKGVQRGLNSLGLSIPVNGILGRRTMDGLQKVSGPLWHGKAWVQIYGDLQTARRKGVRLGLDGAHGMGEYVAMGASPDLITLGAFGVGAFLIYRAIRAK